MDDSSRRARGTSSLPVGHETRVLFPSGRPAKTVRKEDVNVIYSRCRRQKLSRISLYVARAARRPSRRPHPPGRREQKSPPIRQAFFKQRLDRMMQSGIAQFLIPFGFALGMPYYVFPKMQPYQLQTDISHHLSASARTHRLFRPCVSFQYR